MFWNKIPKGYVETVDGYIVKESECKRIKMATDDLRGETVGYYQWYKKENAPKYDVCVTNQWSLARRHSFYKTEVRVNKDGTPIGYYSKEEVEKLEAEIKELKNKYEPITAGGIVGILDEACNISMGDYYTDQVEIGKKPKKKGRGRPKGSKNKK